MAAKKKNKEGLAFIVDALKKNRNAVYADVREAAAKKGFTIYPIMYGKAKLMLGHVKRGQGKAKQAARHAGAAMGVRRGPGRPRKNPQPATTGLGAIDSIVAAVRDSQRELSRFRGALEKIQAVIAQTM